MSEETTQISQPDPSAKAPDYTDELVAAVKAAQLSICTQIVPAALTIRLKAAAAAKATGARWVRNAGHKDPKVRELEAPYLRVQPKAEEPAPKSSGRRQRRSTPKNTKKGN